MVAMRQTRRCERRLFTFVTNYTNFDKCLRFILVNSLEFV